jgi:hypothetical protein
MNSQNTKQKPINPVENASRLSKMTFWWCKDIYRKGITGEITNEDVYKTIDHHECDRVAEKFIKLWNDELEQKNPSTIRMFYRAYGTPVLILGLMFSLCETIMRCAQPLLLGKLLDYFADDENTSKSTAYLYGGGIVLCSLIPVLTFHPFIFYIFEIGMKIRIGSSRLVYDKVSAHNFFNICY